MFSKFQIISTILLLSSPNVDFLAQAEEQAPIVSQPVEIIKDAASSISSVFAGLAPSKTGHQQCCGDDCPPGACDINRMIPTDLGYLYPKPTVPPHKTYSTSISFPCCGLECVDGGCRTKGLTSQRPIITDALFNRSNTLNVIIGGEQTVLASPTTTATVQDLVPCRDTTLDFCIGCHPCTPCHGMRLTTYVEFLARPTDSPDSEEFLRRRAVSQSYTRGIVTDCSTPDPDPDPTDPSTPAASAAPAATSAEPTYILGDDIANSINGNNQDLLPIIIQSHSKEPITLLAEIDLKVQENYLSHRILSHLGLSSKFTAYPKGLHPSKAVLSPDLHQVNVNSTIVLNVITPGKDSKLIKNVRFQIYAPVDLKEVDKIEISDIVIGSKFLRELGGLTIFPGFKGPVAHGVKVLHPAHTGTLVNVRDEFLGFVADEVPEHVKHEEL